MNKSSLEIMYVEVDQVNEMTKLLMEEQGRIKALVNC
jgi:hypothetical protein